MSAIGIVWELWSGLSFKTKFTLCTAALLAMIGLPRSELGLVWKEARVAVGMQNCISDSTNPLFDAAERGDYKSIEAAVAPEKERQLKECGANAIQHPKGTVSFLLDEYRRRPAGAHH